MMMVPETAETRAEMARAELTRRIVPLLVYCFISLHTRGIEKYDTMDDNLIILHCFLGD